MSLIQKMPLLPEPVKTVTEMAENEARRQFNENPHEIPTDDCHCIFCFSHRFSKEISKGSP